MLGIGGSSLEGGESQAQCLDCYPGGQLGGGDLWAVVASVRPHQSNPGEGHG